MWEMLICSFSPGEGKLHGAREIFYPMSISVTCVHCSGTVVSTQYICVSLINNNYILQGIFLVKQNSNIFIQSGTWIQDK